MSDVTNQLLGASQLPLFSLPVLWKCTRRKQAKSHSFPKQVRHAQRLSLALIIPEGQATQEKILFVSSECCGSKQVRSFLEFPVVRIIACISTKYSFRAGSISYTALHLQCPKLDLGHCRGFVSLLM